MSFGPVSLEEKHSDSILTHQCFHELLSST